MTEFEPYPKIKRLSGAEMTITEKIDGTNAQIVIKDGKVALVGSRKRAIVPGDDNYGFAAWVDANVAGLIAFLGEGQHFGEWAGIGIQKNPLCLDEKRFFLFNTHRNPKEKFATMGNLVPHLDSVPVLHEGKFDLGEIDSVLDALMLIGSQVEDKGDHSRPEGIVISVFGTKFKRTPGDMHKSLGGDTQ